MKNLKKLDVIELNTINGGSASEYVGLGLATGLLGIVGGPLAMAWGYYNYFKD